MAKALFPSTERGWELHDRLAFFVTVVTVQWDEILFEVAFLFLRFYEIYTAKWAQIP